MRDTSYAEPVLTKHSRLLQIWQPAPPRRCTPLRTSFDARPAPSRCVLPAFEEFKPDLCRARDRGEIRDPDGCPDPGGESPGIPIEDDKHHRSGASSDRMKRPKIEATDSPQPARVAVPVPHVRYDPP